MEAGAFDVAITFDNALPHLVDREDLLAAFGRLRVALRDGGLLLASIRDYDAIAATRPSGEPPRISGAPGARRAVVQGWEWEPDVPVYRLHQFILREEPGGAWSAAHAETRYRAISRSELSAAAVAAGFAGAAWLAPVESGFYQPILAARRPATGSGRS